MITTINRAIAKKNEENDKGFTLIELLVVILIIGVLAAIAIPAFLNQREGAWKAQVESDVKNAALAVETSAVKNNGEYPGDATVSTDGVVTDPGKFKDAGFTGTTGVNVEYKLEADKSYTITGTHEEKDGATVIFNSKTGKTEAEGW